jgi:hypothetical protein
VDDLLRRGGGGLFRGARTSERGDANDGDGRQADANPANPGARARAISGIFRSEPRAGIRAEAVSGCGELRSRENPMILLDGVASTWVTN